MYLSANLLFLLCTTILQTLSHPLNLLHTHHHHHRHRRLRLPLFSSQPAKDKQQEHFQQPLAPAQDPQSLTTDDISNVFVNLTLTLQHSLSEEQKTVIHRLIPLNSSPQRGTFSFPFNQPRERSIADNKILVSNIPSHVRSIKISGAQYGSASTDASRQFADIKDVTCYASSIPQNKMSRRHVRSHQTGEGDIAFRESDGELDFGDAGGKWHLADSVVSSVRCSMG